MDLFDYDGKIKKRGSAQVAEQLLSKLSMSMDQYTGLDASDGSVHNELYLHRFEKAKRAQQKAKIALAGDFYEEAAEHAVRGLLHLDIAAIHLQSGKIDLAQLTAPAPAFVPSSAEETIEMLIDGICRIKLIVEYKSIVLNKSLKQRLAQVVQLLQDAIEAYAEGKSHGAVDANQGAQKAAECGLVWAQFIYGQLTGDELYPKKTLTKSMRLLNQFAWQSTAGLFSAIPSLQKIKEARSHLISLEDSLNEALGAYLDGDSAQLEKYLRLGKIEANSLLKYKEVAGKTSSANSSASEFDLSQDQHSSLRQDLDETGDLLAKQLSDPRTAIITIEHLQTQLTALKRSIKAENWPEVETSLSSARFNCQILQAEIAKLE